MTNTAKTEASLTFDPWPDAGPTGRVEPTPQWAPADWYQLSATARGTIGGVTLALMRSHPDRRSPGDRDWLAHRIHEGLMELRETGDKAADTTIHELDRNPRIIGGMLLRDVVGKLLEAGSHLQTLRRRRTELDHAIERLAQMSGSR